MSNFLHTNIQGTAQQHVQHVVGLLLSNKFLKFIIFLLSKLHFIPPGPTQVADTYTQL